MNTCQHSILVFFTGMVPYPGVGGRDVLGFLLNGFRLDKPSETPFEM